jgi:hypothetical protein
MDFERVGGVLKGGSSTPVAVEACAVGCAFAVNGGLTAKGF